MIHLAKESNPVLQWPTIGSRPISPKERLPNSPDTWHLGQFHLQVLPPTRGTCAVPGSISFREALSGAIVQGYAVQPSTRKGDGTTGGIAVKVACLPFPACFSGISLGKAKWSWQDEVLSKTRLLSFPFRGTRASTHFARPLVEITGAISDISAFVFSRRFQR